MSLAEEDSDRAGWLEERRTGIGGSDAAAAVGLNPRRSPLSLYLEKIGEMPADIPDTEPMRWGRVLEPSIRSEYQRRTGISVIKPQKAVVHPKLPFMRANLDAISTQLPQRVVEIKTARTDKGWGEPGTDDVPQVYLLQCVHYMLVTGAQLADIAVLIGGQDFRVYTIHRNRELDQLVTDGENDFWRCVQQREPPAPKTLDEVNLRWRNALGGRVELPQRAAEACLRLEAIRSALSEQETEAEQCEIEIKKALQEADVGLVDGVVACTWRQAKPSRVFDARQFKIDFPDLYAQFEIERAGSRRFLLKGIV